MASSNSKTREFIGKSYIYELVTNLTPLPTARPLLSDLLPSRPEQFIPVRDVYRVLLEGGASYYFKPARDEDPEEYRYAYLPPSELAVYERFKHL